MRIGEYHPFAGKPVRIRRWYLAGFWRQALNVAIAEIITDDVDNIRFLGRSGLKANPRGLEEKQGSKNKAAELFHDSLFRHKLASGFLALSSYTSRSRYPTLVSCAQIIRLPMHRRP